MVKEKSCGAIICNDEGKFLLIRQVQGHWCFPKGHVEKNETEVETAIREIREETGLHVTIDDAFRYVLSYSPSSNVEKDVVYFIGYLKSGHQQSQLTEVTDIAWLTKEEVLEKITFANDRELFIEALKYLKK